MKKKMYIITYFLLICIAICGCSKNNKGDEKGNKLINNPSTIEQKNTEKSELINSSGKTLETRILAPKGYNRETATANSLASFIRNYPMKDDGSEVLLYNGTPKGNQTAHVAVFKLPIENYDLQQCADSVMRMYAEYFWNTKQYDKISFHFVSGFEAKYSKWIQGYRIKISGNNVNWVKQTGRDTSYESFKEYLKIVFSYASTLSMEKESKTIGIEDIQVGDIFIKGGSPGHVVMVVDVCVNAEGKKAFLLAQGYMPAQEFHVLNNPKHSDDPWYYVDEVTYPLSTPEYSFEEGSLMRVNY